MRCNASSPGTRAQVTGVCSAGNLELVRSLGADEVIDCTKEDVAARSERYEEQRECIAAFTVH